MELIEILYSGKDKKGKWRRYGLFLCPYCLDKVVRVLENGKIQKSCGCVSNKLKSEGNKGKKRTEEQNRRNSEAQKGKKLTEEQRQKFTFLGKHHTEEARQKIRESKQSENHPLFNKFGEENPNFGSKRTEEQRKNISNSKKGKSTRNKGKSKSEEHRQKISKTRIEKGLAKGENNPFYGKHHTEDSIQKIKQNMPDLSREKSPTWQNGKSFEEYGIEFNKELKQFILERDNYKCQCPDCKHISKRLDVHHIDYDKKNNNPENLITLCASCHTKTSHKNKRKYYTEYYQNIMIGKVMECLL